MEENRSDPLSDHRRERDVPASNPGGPGYVQTLQNNATVVVGKLDLDREVARAVQRSGTLNLQGEINVGASITKTENVHHDNRIYKPHYGDVHHKHVTKTYITSKYVVCDDSQASEKSLDASANQSDTLHQRQRNLPKKKISLRNKRKPARVPYNYKLAQAERRSKPLRDSDAGPHRPTFRWMSGTAVLCCLAVVGVLTAALWILPQSESPSTIQSPSTDGRYPHSQQTQTRNADASQKGKHERPQDKKGTGDTKRKDSVNSSPLHKACRDGNLGHIDELLQTDTADVNTRTSSGDTCLHIVSAAGRSDIVSYLVRHHAVIDVKNKLQRTPLHEACRSGHLEVVKALCQHGADTNVVDSEGKTPLTEASTHGYSQIVTVLIERDADVNMHSIFKVGLDTSSTDRRKSNIPQLPEVKQPLMSAVEYGYDEIVQHLLEKQAQVNVPNKQGWIEIHVAAFNGNLSIVEKLADKGADIHAVTDRGATPLTLASQEEYKKKNTRIQNFIQPCDM